MFDFIFTKLLFPLVFLVLLLGGAAVNLSLLGGRMAEDFLAGPKEKSLADRAEAAARKLDEIASTHVAYNTAIVDLYGGLQVFLGKRVLGDFKVVKGNNGELDFGSFKAGRDLVFNDAAFRAVANYYRNLSETAAFRGGKLIFVAPPLRPVKNDPAFEPGLPILDLNPQLDTLLHFLREYNVEFIDLRRHLTADGGLPPERLLYKTDLLWTTEAAFEAFRVVVSQLEERFQMNLDPDGFYRDKANYSFTPYPQFFMGMLGHISGPRFAGRDDFVAIRPTYNDTYSVEMLNPQAGLIERRGGPAETIYYERMLIPFDLITMEPLTLRAHQPYRFYLSDLHSMVTIRNEGRPDGPKILLIGDAFSVPVSCFLAPLATELVTVNPRARQYVPDLQQHLLTREYDLAIVLLTVNSLVSE